MKKQLADLEKQPITALTGQMPTPNFITATLNKHPITRAIGETL